MKAWQNNIRRVVPYTPGEQPGEADIIKLNTNENPYPPSPGLLKVKQDLDGFRLYPDPEAKELVHAVAKYHGLEDNQVFVGVGSDDVLAMSFLTFFNGSMPVYFPDITYSFYDVWADLFRIPYQTKALDGSFGIVATDYYEKNGGVVFPNPNAPTGRLLGIEAVEDIIAHNQDVIVIVDEAYIDFGGVSAVSLIDRYENLLVVRTFSKSRSLAGMRIGYAMGDRDLIKALNDVKYSFNSYTMDCQAILFGVESIKDDGYFKETVAKVVATREWFQDELKRLGFDFVKSDSNFVFASHPHAAAKDIFDAAKKEKIYVRYFDKPRIDNYLRISIGTDEQMKVLVEFLETYLNM